MIPILYAATETDFTSNGIGLLADAISCVPTEELNGYFELTLEYPIIGAHFHSIHDDCVICADANEKSKAQLFRIYKHDDVIDGATTFYARHISYQMLHIPVVPFSTTQCGIALSKLSSNAAVSCPFTFWTDISAEKAFSVSVPSKMRSVLGGDSDSIVSTYGGELEFDNFAVKLHEHRGSDSGVKITYGKNLIDYKQEKHISNIVTGVCPFYKTDDTYVELPEKVVQVSTSYSYPRIEPKDFTEHFNFLYDTAPTVEQLRTAAQSYIDDESLQTPTVSITVDWVQIWQMDEYKNSAIYADVAGLERVGMCDTVTVEYSALDVSATAKVVSYEYDTLLDRYNSMTIGSVASNLADTIINTADSAAAAVKNEVSATITSAKNSLQDSISGAKGGYVLINYGDDGSTAEILIMDSKDKATATNVIRLNQAGISLSKNGYNGDFSAAIGIDGTLFANELNTWELSASIIKTGTLDAELVNVINLIADTVSSTNGNYAMKLWAATFSLYSGIDPRARLYVTSGDANTGALQLYSGSDIDVDGFLSADANYSYFTSTRLGVGQKQDESYNGTVNCGTVSCGTVSCSQIQPIGKNALTVDWVKVDRADGTGAAWALCGT